MKNNSYLRFVRTLPCIHCQSPNAVPHHIIGIGLGHMGGKAADIHTMPLCGPCHENVHKQPKEWPQLQWMIKTQEAAVKAGEL